MLPNNPQNQSGDQSHLPPISAGQPPASVPVGPAAAQPANPDTSIQYAMRAKQVIAQYGNDPYRLAEALNQLKAGYLAQQHHVTYNESGNS
jgi:hypothetical protein